jgi:glyoxylate/hydroxypyruvate reductase A
MSNLCVLIASYLEPEYVERIAAIPGVDVIYEPALLPRPRYRADHHGAPLRRAPQDEARWREYLARAEVLFDFDFTNLDRLLELAPRVRWIQATSAGIGQLLVRTGLVHSQVAFTTASGIHAVPLAEFCLWALLGYVKDAPRLAREQAAHHWERYCGRELRGMTAGIVGLGRVGREVARLCRACGMRIIATRRTIRADDAEAVDELVPADALPRLLGVSDAVILCVPHTPETERMLGARELRAMKRGAYLINIGRGALIDEPALIEALREGHLGGAALDVFATEPLPAASPLWHMPNVIVSPHSASTADTENDKLTALFCENLRRYLARAPLVNRFDPDRLY